MLSSRFFALRAVVGSSRPEAEVQSSKVSVASLPLPAIRSTGRRLRISGTYATVYFHDPTATNFNRADVRQWVIDQYGVTKDDQDHIFSDPNRLDDEQYILRLIGQVITVSLETMKVVKGLADLRFE